MQNEKEQAQGETIKFQHLRDGYRKRAPNSWIRTKIRGGSKRSKRKDGLINTLRTIISVFDLDFI